MTLGSSHKKIHPPVPCVNTPDEVLHSFQQTTLNGYLLIGIQIFNHHRDLPKNKCNFLKVHVLLHLLHQNDNQKKNYCAKFLKNKLSFAVTAFI